MNKLAKAVVVATKKDVALELFSGASELAEKVTVISLGGESAAVNAEIAYCVLLEDSSVVVALRDIVDVVRNEEPQLVLIEQSMDGRLISAAVAASMGCSALTDSICLWREDDRILSKKVVYGGKAHKIESLPCTNAVVSVCVGVFEPAEEQPAGEIKYVQVSENSSVQFVSQQPKQIQPVNLSSAKKVIGVGRGIGDGTKLDIVESLSSKLGAELACTRPVAEEEKLMARERYIGVTGSTIKPELYIALGISGQIQHMAGVNSSGTIIAINKDKNAPIFTQCDYGIVGDIFEVTTKIIENLQ